MRQVMQFLDPGVVIRVQSPGEAERSYQRHVTMHAAYMQAMQQKADDRVAEEKRLAKVFGRAKVVTGKLYPESWYHRNVWGLKF